MCVLMVFIIDTILKNPDALAHKRNGFVSDWLLFLSVFIPLIVVICSIFYMKWCIKQQIVLDKNTSILQTMIDMLPLPVWVYDMDTMMPSYINSFALNMFDCTREAFLARKVHGIWTQNPNKRTALEEALFCLRNCSGAWRFFEEIPTRDGIRFMEIRTCNMLIGQARHQVITAIDRSEEKQNRESFNQAMDNFQKIQHIAQIGVWYINPKTGLGNYSDLVYQFLSKKQTFKEENLRFEDLFTEADTSTRSRLHNLIEELYSDAFTKADILLPIITENDSQRVLHLRAESMHNTEKDPMILGIVQDITEREQSRLLLREREEQFRELVRVFPDGVMILAEESVIYANPACVGQFGYESHDLLGEQLSHLVTKEDLEAVRRLLNQSAQRRKKTVAHAMQRKNNSVFYAALSVGEALYGGQQCRLLVVRDLSEPERIRDALAVSNAELQAMTKRLFSLQEDERRSISRDLHDDIGQAITAMKLSAHAALEEKDITRLGEDLQYIVQLADTTIIKLRNLSMLLRPPQLDALGLEAALRWQATLLFRTSQTRLELDITPLQHRPDHEIEQACFRIAQESLTNALRHSQAQTVRLQFASNDSETFQMRIFDDGIGLEPCKPRGLGLIMMRERAQMLGGSVTLHSSSGSGTSVLVNLPYHIQACCALPDELH